MEWGVIHLSNKVLSNWQIGNKKKYCQIRIVIVPVVDMTRDSKIFIRETSLSFTLHLTLQSKKGDMKKNMYVGLNIYVKKKQFH